MSSNSLVVMSEPNQILEQLQMAVQAKTAGRIHGLRVRIDDGCLVVSGRTSTYYNKQLATHAIRHAGLQMAFQNNVEVCRELAIIGDL